MVTVFAVIGVLLVTAIFGYFAIALAVVAYCCFTGFDEVNIPAGIVCTILSLFVCAMWWFLVGTHIMIGFS